MWSWARSGNAKKLDNPPISEVVCGFLFESIEDIDPVSVGAFWSKHRLDFPKRSIQPALRSSGPAGQLEVFAGTPPQRVWLSSEDDQLLLQVQNDRFYVNWRKRSGGYPRFSGPGGLLERALRHYESFCEFLGDTWGISPDLKAVELTKVDQLLQGEHWKDTSELPAILPALEPWLRLMEGGLPHLQLALEDRVDEHHLTVRLGMSAPFAPKRSPRQRLQLQTTVVSSLGTKAASEVFAEANDAANGVFFELIPEPELSRLFCDQPQPEGGMDNG